MSEVGRQIRAVGIRGGTPEASVVEDAVFVPTARGQTAGQPKFSGGLVTADGEPIEAVHLRRKRGRVAGGLVGSVAVAPERDVDEEVVYLGWLFEHFGRVLLESLARVWVLNDVGPSVRVVFSHQRPRWRTPPEWVRRILEAFGVPLDRILVLEAPTRLRRVIVPEPLFEQVHAAHEGMIGPFRNVASRIASDVRPSDQPVYLSRRLLSSRQRPIIGEGELEDVLRDNGFLIAHPQTMAFEDQVRLVNAHSDIFSSAGSAAHNVLFALNRPRLHLLTNEDLISPNFFLCSALAEAPTTFVNCLGGAERPSFAAERKAQRARRRAARVKDPSPKLPGRQATPQFAEMPKLVDYLGERGLLTDRSRASRADRGATMANEYDEAWFYTRLRRAGKGRQALPAEVEHEAVSLAARSWPLSLVLAWYYAVAREDAARADGMANQFAALAAAEFDENRLAHYRAEVNIMARRLTEVCGPETAGRLAEVVSDRFLVGPQGHGETTLDGP